MRTDKCNILRAAKKRTKARNKRWDRLRRQVDKGKITLTHGCVCCLQARVMIGALYCGDPWCAREDFISNELEHRSVVLARESIHQRKMVRGGKLDESPCVERTLFFLELRCPLYLLSLVNTIANFVLNIAPKNKTRSPANGERSPHRRLLDLVCKPRSTG